MPTTTAADLAAAFAWKCDGAKQTGEDWWVRCPAHDDHTPSLKITPKDDRILLRCFAECDNKTILDTMGLGWDALFVQPRSTEKWHDSWADLGPIVGRYDYTDASGTVVHQTVRFRLDDGTKTMRQHRPHPDHPGRWLRRVRDITQVLYHLPQVITAIAAGELVYLVEGEKDADSLEAVGLTATTNPAGVKSWKSHYDETLRGAHLVCLPDFDPGGQRHMANVATRLQGIAASIKLLTDIHTAAAKSDVSDWLAEGHTRAELEAAVAAAQLWTPTPIDFKAAAPPATNGMHPQVAETDIWMGASLGDDTDWQEELFKKPTKKHDEYYPSEFNITHILRHDPTWRHEDGKPDHVMWYDVIRGRSMIDDEPLTDGLLIKLAHWFGGRWRMQFNSTALLEKCVNAHCESNKRDLIQIWLNGLPPWDNTPRLDTWLRTIAQASDDAYTRHLSRRLPLSMVARALVPGCQYREVVILEGPQNVGKSHILQALASRDWYVEMSMNLETKESHMMLQSAWLAELSELDSMNRTEKARLKAFITMEMDTYVPKYRNGTVTYPRRTIMVGTTNDIEYLTDLTGNSRFLPVYTPGPITLEPLHEMREQLFAEALQAYRDAGEEWWRMSDEVAQEAAFQQEDRRVTSEWQAPLENWLAFDRFTQTYYETVIDPATGHTVQRRVEFKEGVTSWEEIARWFLGIEKREGWRDSRVTNPILNCLRAMGWKRGKRTRSGGQGQISHWYKAGYESAFDEPWNF